MKKVFLKAMSVIAVAVLMTGCAGKSDTNANVEALAEGEEGIENPAGDQAAVTEMGIIMNENDNAYAPDKKVDKLTIIDFNATWCVPCRKFEPIFQQAAGAYKDKVEFVSIDIDKCPETANKFNVTAVPTVVLIQPDGTVSSFVGLEDITPYEKFAELVDSKL